MAKATTTRVAVKKAAAKKPSGTVLDNAFVVIGEKLGDLFGRVNGAEQRLDADEEAIDDHAAHINELHEVGDDLTRRIVELENPQFDEDRLNLWIGEMKALK